MDGEWSQLSALITEPNPEGILGPPLEYRFVLFHIWIALEGVLQDLIAK